MKVSKLKHSTKVAIVVPLGLQLIVVKLTSRWTPRQQMIARRDQDQVSAEVLVALLPMETGAYGALNTVGKPVSRLIGE